MIEINLTDDGINDARLSGLVVAVACGLDRRKGGFWRKRRSRLGNEL